MQSDVPVRHAIAEMAAAVRPRELTRAAAVLSERYRTAELLRDARSAGHIRSDEEAVAYLVTRFPATFAACRRATELAAEGMAEFRPRTLMDVGAGTAASALAAAATWPTLQSVRLVEPDERMRRVGTELLGRLGVEDGWEWLTCDAADVGAAVGSADAEPPDVVTMSYVLGELAPERAVDMVRRWWDREPGVLVIVEPGTPAGFGLVHRIREELIRRGGQVAAPCPHDGACPIVDVDVATDVDIGIDVPGDVAIVPGGPGPGSVAGDWCHFAVRLARSAEHRRLKGGQLAYEDEKFSFVAVTREPVTRPASRIVRRPTRARRKVELVLCTADGLVRETVPQSAPAYRAATKAEWGGGWTGPAA